VHLLPLSIARSPFGQSIRGRRRCRRHIAVQFIQIVTIRRSSRAVWRSLPTRNAPPLLCELPLPRPGSARRIAHPRVSTMRRRRRSAGSLSSRTSLRRLKAANTRDAVGWSMGKPARISASDAPGVPPAPPATRIAGSRAPDRAPASPQPGAAGVAGQPARVRSVLALLTYAVLYIPIRQRCQFGRLAKDPGPPGRACSMRT